MILCTFITCYFVVPSKQHLTYKVEPFEAIHVHHLIYIDIWNLIHQFEA